MSLFAFFGLWETTLLAGAGAVSVPIIIHLLNRRRFKVVIWAAMRFLLAAQKQNTRRMRLEQIILLIVRTVLVALIVFAMASVMPWMENVWAAIWPEGSGVHAGGAGRTHHILVLDGSLSMNLTADGKSLFDRARQMALDKVKESPSGDGFSVLLMKDSPVWIVGEASHDGRKVVREIEQLRAGHGNASVPATLNMVAAKVAEGSSRFPVQNVYFFTDMQRSTWLSVPPDEARAEGKDDAKDKLAYVEIGRGARTIFVDLGRDDAKNLAVTDLRLDDSLITTGAKIRVQAQIKNYSQEAKKLHVELLAGRAREVAADNPYSLRTVGQPELVKLEPNESKQIYFEYTFASPGTYAVQVKLESDDLEPDDSRAVVVTVKDTIPVLLVNGKPAGDPYERATEYLKLALNPFRPGSEPKFAPLRPKVISAAQFVDTSEADLAAYDCIFLCDVPQFGSGELRRLEGHLRRGGGIFVSLGDRAAENLEVYNRLLFKNEQGLLPAKLFKKIQAPVDHHFTLNAQDEQFLEPPLKAFKDDDDRISLRSGRFRQYVQAKAAGDAKVRTILTYLPELDALVKTPLDKTLANDNPALLEWNPPLVRDQGAAPAPKGGPRSALQARYRGKVLLFTSTVNMDWNSWPGSPSFGAMMQEATRLAASGRLREQAALVGQMLEEYFPASGNEVDAVIAYPANLAGLKPQKIRTQVIEDMGVFRFSDTDYAGIYKMTVGSDPREYLFAVNVPATRPDQGGSESDLARTDKATLEKVFPGWDFQLVTDPRQANYTGGGPAADIVMVRGAMGPFVAHWVLLVVLVLVLAEVILAWQFGHYSSVEGSAVQVARGRALPITIAAVAGAVFLFGAFVLIHTARTGDFLGFMPDGLRALALRFLGAPAALVGENTRWYLEGRRWLPEVLDEKWLLVFLAFAAVALVYFTYRAEGPTVHPVYKLLLGSLRIFLFLAIILVLAPQQQGRPEMSENWPDVVLLIDDSRSMGEPDHFQDEKIRERAKKLGEDIKKRVQDTLPDKIKALHVEIAAKSKAAADDARLRSELEALTARLQFWQNQLATVNSTAWHPTRLQLAQALIAQPEQDWLKFIHHTRRNKVHIYHLDHEGRAIKLTDAGGVAGEITDRTDPALLERAHRAIANLEAEGNDSRLGTALRQVIDHYRGSSLSAVIMFTDGVTTKDETIQQLGDYAAQKAVPLLFVGIGDDHEIRDLKLGDLQVEDTVFVNDRVVFNARLTGQGYKDLTVPVVLKVKEKDGKEKELARVAVKVDPNGKKFKLDHKPTEVGRKQYIIEVETPKSDRIDKGPSPGAVRLDRTIDIIDTKLTKVLYIEGSPRYEYRFVKSLLERENPDAKKNKSVDLRVLLLEADPDFAKTDKSALADFPATRAELEQYDVVILGDCDPRHPMLGKERLKMLADFVRGEDNKGKKTGKTGTGLLMLAGPLYAPHAYKNTPLAEILPIEPLGKGEPEKDRTVPFRMELTPIGRLHPMFKFASDEGENMAIWQKLAPMYWWSSGYRLKPLAEVLAVHPKEKAIGRDPNQDGRHPLVVQHFVGSGRCMFIGVDEIWRWRFRDDESRFNNFWIQTSRYLSRSRISKTDLRLDRQTPYRAGEPIKVTVRFPESVVLPGGDVKGGLKGDVKVTVEYRPTAPKDGAPGDPEVQTLALAKLEGSLVQYEGLLGRTREGKYRFRLTTPDVTKQQPDGEKPSAEATVELPPGELDRLRMNQQEMTAAAEATQGRFYTLATADSLLDDLPPGFRVALITQQPPLLIWNHWLMFLVILGLVASEWILRKRKHLL
jgi:hypothetical protein